MADLLDSIRRELRTRLDELRPLVREYERLQRAEAALNDGSPSRPRRARRSGEEASASAVKASRRGARRSSSTPAAREANREKILALVRERPGITRGELKEAAGLSGAGIAQTLRRLVERGEVRETELPGGQVGYRLGDGDREGGGEPGVESRSEETAGPTQDRKARSGGSGRRKLAATRGRKSRSRRKDTDAAPKADVVEGKTQDATAGSADSGEGSRRPGTGERGWLADRAGALV
jgi:hypothetical protein